jgi:hypothetical protein
VLWYRIWYKQKAATGIAFPKASRDELLKK